MCRIGRISHSPPNRPNAPYQCTRPRISVVGKVRLTNGLRGKDHRWDRPYTKLVYQPMQEVLGSLRANGHRTYIVTGGGQAFVPTPPPTASKGSPPAELIGSSLDRLRARCQGTGRAVRGAQA